MVRGSMSSKRKLFDENQTTRVEKYFVMDTVLDWAGNASLGIIGTNERNRLLKYIELIYLHKENTNATMKHTKAVQFFDSIVAVKNDSRGLQSVHISLQSTSSCNIASINALNERTNFFELQEKGRGNHKQQWVIEMNHARRIYLETY